MAYLNKEQFFQALEIISRNHSTSVVINLPQDGFVGDMGKDYYRIHIKECCPSVINNLLKENYSLSMGNNGLEVLKYSRN